MNIFVAKLNFQTQENALKSLFARYGEVESVKIVIDKLTGKSKGFGFVQMPNDDEAKTAIEAINESVFEGRTIVAKEAEPRPAKREGGRYDGGGYGGNSGGGYNSRNRY